MSDLEKDFDEIAKKINAKLKKAGQLMAEANQIAKDAGLKTLHLHPNLGVTDYGIDEEDEDFYESSVMDAINFGPILNQMKAAGWSTSGFEC